MKKASVVAANVLWIGMVLASCGRATDMANVTLNIGIPTHDGLKELNLMKNLTSLTMLTAAPSCKQKNLYAAIRLNNDNEQTFSYPIDVSTPIGTSPTGNPDAVTKLFLGATLNKDIIVPVPKGAVFDFGVFGAFADPQNTDVDGNCEVRTGGVYAKNYVASGRRKAIVTGDTTLGLRVFTHESGPDTPIPGCLDSNDTDNINLGCAKKHFLNLQRVNNSDSFAYVAIEYLFSKTLLGHVFQGFNSWLNGLTVKLPRVFPIVIHFKYTSGGAVDQIQVIREPDAVDLATTLTGGAGTANPFYVQRF